MGKVEVVPRIFIFQAGEVIRDVAVTGVQTCVLFFSSRRRHTRCSRDWSSDVCSSDLPSNGALLGEDDRIVDGGREIEQRRLHVGAPGLDLGEIEDVIDEREEVASRVQDVLRSEEHTSELQSRLHLVCRLLLEKKKKIT